MKRVQALTRYLRPTEASHADVTNKEEQALEYDK